MLLLSKILFTPPKTPRNVFFPWQVFCLHRSGSFLERNRIALRVPINLTKFEIREYLRKIYKAKVIKVNTLIKVPERRRCLTDFRYNYYRNGPMYKKAIATLEHPVSDEVKMISSCRNIGRNPAITKKNVSYGVNSDLKQKPLRSQLWAMGECRYSWRLPIPNLLAGNEWNLNPDMRINDDDLQMMPDLSKPFIHSGLPTKVTCIPEDVPKQTFPTMNLTPWRKQVDKIFRSGTLLPKDNRSIDIMENNYFLSSERNVTRKTDVDSATKHWKPPS